MPFKSFFQEIRRYLKNKKPYTFAQNDDDSNVIAESYNKHDNSFVPDVVPETYKNITDTAKIPCVCSSVKTRLRYVLKTIIYNQSFSRVAC